MRWRYAVGADGIYAANHAELDGSYNQAMLQYIPRGNKDALSFWQCPGINMDCEIFHCEPPT
jgi:hypothetical protein